MPSFHPSTGIFLPGGCIGKGCASGLALGPPPFLRAQGRGWNQILEPASSIGSQGRSIPFREDVVESATRASFLVASNHPSVPPPLEMVNIYELQSPSSGTLPRINISIRNRLKQTKSRSEIPNLSQQNPLPQNKTIFIEEVFLGKLPKSKLLKQCW